MGRVLRFERYDFSNNINVTEPERQERKVERLLAQGWTVQVDDLTDVFYSVLWVRDDSQQEAPSTAPRALARDEAELKQALQELAEEKAAHEEAAAELEQLRSQPQHPDLSQELHDASQRAEHAEDEANGLRRGLNTAQDQLRTMAAERDQAREAYRQLQAREGQAGGVAGGDVQAP
jgi:DNA repair exonuclease SbcCD ATPase subunit